MKAASLDPLLDRILYDRKLSGGRMPITIIIKDEAEKARGIALCRRLRNVGNLSFATEAEIAARRQPAAARSGTTLPPSEGASSPSR